MSCIQLFTMKLVLFAVIATLTFSQRSTSQSQKAIYPARTSQPYSPPASKAPKGDQKAQYQELGQLFKNIGKATK